jgi:hypothetical protein
MTEVEIDERLSRWGERNGHLLVTDDELVQAIQSQRAQLAAIRHAWEALSCKLPGLEGTERLRRAIHGEGGEGWGDES